LTFWPTASTFAFNNEANMTDDLLARLKSDLQRELAALAKAKVNVQELKAAIAAVEDTREPQEEANREQPARVVRRGDLKRALLDCLREGIGARTKFDAALKLRGVETSSNSISNALNRMAKKKEIRWDAQSKVYVLADEEGLSTGMERPHQSNGATGSHTVAGH
jgi:hypothetical protein